MHYDISSPYPKIGSTHSYDIFKFVRQALNPESELSRYEVPKAALRLVAKHAGQLQHFLVQEYQVQIIAYIVSSHLVFAK